MEEKKNNNTLTTVVITILVMLVLGLGGFIGYDKLINKTDNEPNTTTESKECDCPEVVEEEKGKCPFTKVDSSYVLTDQDKDDIIESLDKLGTGFTKEKIIKDSIKVVNSDNNYRLYLTVEMTPEPDANNSFGALVIRVNGKFKVLSAGSGYDLEELKSLDYYLNNICK